MLPTFDDSAVAKDIEAVCSKCGESWHVIVAVSDGKIAQVQCKSCGGYHKYRPIATERMTLKKNTKSSIAASTKTGSPITSKGGAKTPAAPKTLRPKVDPNDHEIQKYSMKTAHFDLGDRISHPKYGVGVIDEFPSQGKMYVTFEHERVLLVYGK